MYLDSNFEWVATRLRNGWALRPKGTVGTCGWINGKPWQVIYTKRKPSHIPEGNDMNVHDIEGDEDVII